LNFKIAKKHPPNLLHLPTGANPQGGSVTAPFVIRCSLFVIRCSLNGL